jgi:hypothetical protein
MLENLLHASNSVVLNGVMDVNSFQRGVLNRRQLMSVRAKARGPELTR